VPLETFRDRIAGDAPVIDRAVWYLVADGNSITTERIPALSAGAAAVLRQVDTLLPETRNPVTPVDGFRGYQRAVSELTVLLAAFNVPIITLVLAFIVLITGLAVDQRRNEIAVIRSRGATPWQVVGFAVVEGVVLGLLALVLGALLALALTRLIGQTRTFLDFSADYRLRVTLTQAGLRAGLLAVGLAVVAQVLPTLSAARETIISYKQEQARAVRRPWWQRGWVDVALFGLTLYGFYLLRQQGSILALGAGGDDPFQNPLLFLLPSLAVLSLALLFLRLFPWLMEGFSRLAARSDSVGLLLAGRQLARAPRGYAMPLILLVLTVSLAAFSASLATTLDLQLNDALLYRTGADVALTGAGVDFTPPGPFEQPTADTAAGGLFLPLDEYLELPGVVAATRLGRYPAEAQVGETEIAGTSPRPRPGRLRHGRLLALRLRRPAVGHAHERPGRRAGGAARLARLPGRARSVAGRPDAPDRHRARRRGRAGRADRRRARLLPHLVRHRGGTAVRRQSGHALRRGGQRHGL
jgi:putative ABC transport system permease protein